MSGSTLYHDMRMVDQFVESDRDVDLVILPRADAGYEHYAMHRRWDHLVRYSCTADDHPATA